MVIFGVNFCLSQRVTAEEWERLDQTPISHESRLVTSTLEASSSGGVSLCALKCASSCQSEQRRIAMPTPHAHQHMSTPSHVTNVIQFIVSLWPRPPNGSTFLALFKLFLSPLLWFVCPDRIVKFPFEPPISTSTLDCWPGELEHCLEWMQVIGSDRLVSECPWNLCSEFSSKMWREPDSVPAQTWHSPITSSAVTVLKLNWVWVESEGVVSGTGTGIWLTEPVLESRVAIVNPGPPYSMYLWEGHNSVLVDRPLSMERVGDRLSSSKVSSRSDGGPLGLVISGRLIVPHRARGTSVWLQTVFSSRDIICSNVEQFIQCSGVGRPVVHVVNYFLAATYLSHQSMHRKHSHCVQ